jgi:arylsulfatase
MPTFIEVSGAKYPKSLYGIEIKPYQGKSLVSAFKGSTSERGPLFFEHEADRAVIDGKWKLVSTKLLKAPYEGKWELYDLSIDRAEENNLIETHPNIVIELEQKWNRWAKENNVLPLDARGWKDKIQGDINNERIKK